MSDALAIGSRALSNPTDVVHRGDQPLERYLIVLGGYNHFFKSKKVDEQDQPALIAQLSHESGQSSQGEAHGAGA